MSVASNVGHLSFASELFWLIYLWAINPGECCNHFIPVHARVTRAYSHLLQDNKSSIFFSVLINTVILFFISGKPGRIFRYLIKSKWVV